MDFDDFFKSMRDKYTPKDADSILNHIDFNAEIPGGDIPFFPNYNIKFAHFPESVDTSLKREVDIERIIKTFDRDLNYPDNLLYPFETRKYPGGNCTGLLWVCENCGYTSMFSYRNDSICHDAIFFCEHCKTSQCLNYYNNGDDKILDLKCVAECKKEDGLVPFNGTICPICGGKIIQFNGIHLKREYVNYSYNNANKRMSIMDIIAQKSQE